MNVTEGVTQVAHSTVEILKSTPVLLAILVFNLAFMGLIAWITHAQGERNERVFETVVKYCVPPYGGQRPQ